MDLDELERHLPKDNLEPLVLGTSEKLAMNASVPDGAKGFIFSW